MIAPSNFLKMLTKKIENTPYFKMGEIWFILIMISIMGIIDIPLDQFISLPSCIALTATVLIAGLKATIIVSLLIVTKRIKWLHILMIFLIAIYSLLCLFNALGYCLYNMGISITLITVIGQSNKEEIMEFIPTAINNLQHFLATPTPYIWLGVTVLVVTIFRRIPLGIVKFFMVAIPCGGIICVALICRKDSDRSNISIPLRTARAVAYAFREMNYIKEQLAKIPPLPDSASVKSKLSADIIMVVGESASRDNLSIYGHDLHTTPFLDSIKERLILFDNVIGSSTITVKNIKRILTFLNDSDTLDNWNNSPMLFSLMNEAGYYTSWISNQEIGGFWGNSTPALVSMADDIRFAGILSSEDALTRKFDNILLPEIREVLSSNNQPKFIGIHLMGSHYLYHERYPDEFDYFSADSIMASGSGHTLNHSQATVRAQYENSILYTDYILSEIIKDTSHIKRPALLIYFSDHGENVYDYGDNYYGHDTRKVEVPFIIYPNTAFVNEYPEVVQRLKEVCHLSMSTASVCHLICSLTSTEYSYYDPTRDITSPSYIIRPRYVDDKIWENEK